MVAGETRFKAEGAWRQRVMPPAMAELIELGALPGRATGLPAGATTVMCGHGERAASAASLLERAGRTDLSIMVGGPADWATATGRGLDTNR